MYQRPYDKYLNALKERVKLKQNTLAEPKNDIEKVIIDLESAVHTKSENTRINTLQKSFGLLVNYEETEYVYDPNLNLVKEEIEKEKIKFKQESLVNSKQRIILGKLLKKIYEKKLILIIIFF